jgi:hypothetical protein
VTRQFPELDTYIMLSSSSGPTDSAIMELSQFDEPVSKKMKIDFVESKLLVESVESATEAVAESSVESTALVGAVFATEATEATLTNTSAKRVNPTLQYRQDMKRLLSKSEGTTTKYID